MFYGLYNYENKSKLHRKWFLISQERDSFIVKIPNRQENIGI